MATPATSLMAGFDFNLTSQTTQLPSLQSNPTPPKRPPTPDPRHTPRPHTPHTLYPSCSSLSGGENRRRLRRKPTAIYLGNDDRQQQTSAHWPNSSEAEPLLVPQYSSHPTLTPLLPLTPSTRSPPFATSPSLSSSGTTVQSSPTLTPTTAYFGDSYSQLKPATKSLDVFDAWDNQKGIVGLRRAKRLPHRDQGIWEVHAIVHVSSGNLGKEVHQERREEKQQRQREQEQRDVGELISEPLPRSTASTTALREHSGDRYRRPKGFKGIHSESESRENGLRKAQEANSSTYTISKFHFPAPPGNYNVGPGGDVQHPTKVHYRGASFDLVNPHASLLLSASHTEASAEIDGLLDDYFEDSDTMPRALYSNPATARRNIMGLDGAGDTVDAASSNAGSSAESLVPPRAPSDPFDLRVSDASSQAAELPSGNTAEDSTIAELVGDYEYTRETPFEHEDTLRDLESGEQAPHSDDVFSQLPDDVQQHMSGELSLRESDLPTSERTYGDTSDLLGLGRRRPNLSLARNSDESEPRMRPAPGRSTTATTEMTIASGVQSAQASVHDGNSPLESPASNTTERARGSVPMYMNCRDLSDHTVRSNDAGDWETERSDSNPELPPFQVRPSQESYANTSTYSETNRLSAISNNANAIYPPYELPADDPVSTPIRNAEDVERARMAFKKIYKNKRVEEKISDFIGEFSSKGTRQRGGGILQGLRERRPSAIMEAREDDIELEELRKRNPQAVRRAAEQFVAEHVAESPSQKPKPMPMGRLRSLFSRSNLGGAEQRENRTIMDETFTGPQEDDRNLLAQTPTSEGQRSQFQYSESAATFRTIRGDSPTPWANFSRPGRPVSPAVPAATYSPDNRRERAVRQGPRMADRAPRRPIRQAAMSSQTSLRNLITSGSPTSNIQGAFTDRQMFEASRRWDPFGRPYQRYNGRNASGPFPALYNNPFTDPDVENRALVRPGEALDPRLKALQERLSKWYLMRMLPLPPLCIMYGMGHFDYLIEKRSQGDIKTMSASKKFDALCYGVLVGMLYVLILVGVITTVMILKR